LAELEAAAELPEAEEVELVDTAESVEVGDPQEQTTERLALAGQEVEAVAEGITEHMGSALAVVAAVALAFLALAPMGLEGLAALSQEIPLLVEEVVVLGRAVLERAPVAMGILSQMDKVVAAVVVPVVRLAVEAAALALTHLAGAPKGQAVLALSVSSGVLVVAIRRTPQTSN
jgi:hypothetical protein